MQIAVERVQRIIRLTEELQAEYPPSRDGLQVVDGAVPEIVRRYMGDPKRLKLVAEINALPDKERVELRALALLGRGEPEESTFEDFISEGIPSEDIGLYLAPMAPLAGYLKAGLTKLNLWSLPRVARSTSGVAGGGVGGMRRS